jgi:heme exporter protein D
MKFTMQLIAILLLPLGALSAPARVSTPIFHSYKISVKLRSNPDGYRHLETVSEFATQLPTVLIRIRGKDRARARRHGNRVNEVARAMTVVAKVMEAREMVKEVREVVQGVVQEGAREEVREAVREAAAVVAQEDSKTLITSSMILEHWLKKSCKLQPACRIFTRSMWLGGGVVHEL